MCVVSMVMDHYKDRWFDPMVPNMPTVPPWPNILPAPPTVTPMTPAEQEKKTAEVLEAYKKALENQLVQKNNDALIADLRKRIEVQEDLIKTLTREFEDMKQLLTRAKEYDVRNNEPDCEVDEKVQLMLKLADLLGVDPGKVLRGEANVHE